MATTTTRLGLTKPAGSENVNVAQLNGNMDILDQYPGVLICTSTTRPGSPYAGQIIYETDTGRLNVRSGSVWYELTKTGLTSNKPYRDMEKTSTGLSLGNPLTGWVGASRDPGNTDSSISYGTAGTGLFSCADAGLYQINANIRFTFTTTTGNFRAWMYLFLNGTVYATDYISANAASTSWYWTLQISAAVPINASDTFNLQVDQDGTAATITGVTNTGAQRLSVARIGPR